ncbi:MAG: esterase [Bacteroidales bacterium]|nr:esterase [Bacteroidales bacterium]
MRSKIICTILLLSILPAALPGQTQRHVTKFQGEERPYWLYLPENAGPETPLVILLHGHGGKAEGYRPEMAALAAKEGFALCLPQGLKDSKVDKSGWNVRYPVQEGLKRDDIAFVRYLRRHLSKKFGIAEKNAFLCGMSNGGEMCYIMAYRYPREFKAIASIAGLTMQWLRKEYRPEGPVPFMEVHGTADRTSMWKGDPTNSGGWGEYIAVPLAVGAIATASRCTYETCDTIPSKRDHTVILHRFLGCDPAAKGRSAAEVRLYEVQGGGHSWALKDFDTCQEVWDFFRTYLE